MNDAFIAGSSSAIALNVTRYLAAMKLNDKLSDHYDNNAALREGIAMAMLDFEYPDWSHKSMRDLLWSIEPQYAIHIARSAFDVDDKHGDAVRVKEYLFQDWARRSYRGVLHLDELNANVQSGGAYPKAFLNEVEGVCHFNRRAQGTFADYYIDANGFPVGDTFVYHLRAKLYGVPARGWTKVQNAALARSMTSAEMAAIMKTGLAQIKEVEAETLKGLGRIFISSVGAENIYFIKDGQPYFSKVGFTDQYPDGEVDMNDTGKLSDIERFDAIAMVTVYLHADLNYKSSAKLALNKLLLHKDPLVPDRQAMEEFLDGANGDFASEYNKLFEQLILDEREDWIPFIDRYGAKGFKDGAGEVVFSGDECGMYPYYTSHKSILERLELQDELNADLPSHGV